MRTEQKNGTKAPTVSDLLSDLNVTRALEQAWVDSMPNDPDGRHEEGGWIYADAIRGNISIRRAAAGAQATLDLRDPPIVAGSVVVATFHTHPNPASEGWQTGPS